MISQSAVAAIRIFALVGFFGPIVLAVIWKIKTKQPVSTMLVGLATFFVFAMILERIPQVFLLTDSNPAGHFVLNTPWAYMLVGALLAGVFEETGRLVAFKYIIKKKNDKLTAISYGIGHGGGEALILMGIGGLQYMSYVTMANSGQLDVLLGQVAATAPEQVATVQALIAQLSAMTIGNSLMAIWERVSAIFLHIGCSILVFKAVKEEGKMWFYPLAILVHTAMDLVAVAYQTGLISSLPVIEILLTICGVAAFLISYKKVYLPMPETYGSVESPASEVIRQSNDLPEAQEENADEEN